MMTSRISPHALLADERVSCVSWPEMLDAPVDRTDGKKRPPLIRVGEIDLRAQAVSGSMLGSAHLTH
ncbi:MAG: hypothetical protein H8E44_26170 [Planctomycetes bacterium]|nr:hypothetical protein [Planctomycetota bacterium]MBL7041694.1 hypothetical protein [Pirellulaceae bacterium]